MDGDKMAEFAAFVVHTGLIEATRSEDELAGVLAHEIAHIN